MFVCFVKQSSVINTYLLEATCSIKLFLMFESLENRCNVSVFSKIIFSNKLDLLRATCSNIFVKNVLNHW